MTEDGLELDKQVCFALYSATRAVTQLYRPVLDALGLTYPQYLVMLVLWELGPVCVKDLGTELALDSGTLSPLLKRLETQGHIRRERSTEDERILLVSLTETGAALRARATGVPRKIAGATGMGLAELEALRQNLVRLTESVGAHRLTPDE
jgi:MarR family transcriptional regulator, organic hydroperoxide resistance regulator